MESTGPSAEERLLGALAYPYWYLAFPLFLLASRYQGSKFLRYHCYQGLCLGLLVLWGGVALWTSAAFIGKLIPIYSLLLYPFLRLAEWLAWLLTFYGAGQAFLGRRAELPYVTDLVRPYLNEPHER